MTNIFKKKDENRREEKRNAKLSKAHRTSKTKFSGGVMKIKNFLEKK